MNPRSIGLVVASFAILGSLIAGTVPVSAKPALGTGLIRVDGAWATVKTLPSGTTVLTLNKEATGQWMGEVGRSLVPVVRDIDDRDLVSVWNEIGHNSGTGVDATVTWNSLGNFERVDLRDPSLTPRGHLRFVVNSDSALPARLANISVNIARSDSLSSRAYPLSINYQFTSTASARTYLQYAYVAQVTLNNAGINCYEYTLLQSAPTATLPSSINCGSVIFTNSTSSLSLPNSIQNGDVVFYSSISASGTPFSFAAVIASWTETGS